MEATVIGYTLSSKMGQCLSQRHLVNTEGGGIQREKDTAKVCCCASTVGRLLAPNR